jgi:hypothetical protein
MKMNILVSLMAMLLSMAAYAKDEPVTIDGKHILVTDVSEMGWGNSALHTNDLKNGVYVQVTSSSNVDSHLPNAEKVIASELESHGIKIADKLEGSSVAILWSSSIALDMAKADQAAAYSALPNAGQVAAGGGQMIGAVMNSARSTAGGVGGLVGFLAGELFNTDSKMLLQTGVYKDPIYAKVGLFGIRGIKSTSDDSIHQPSLKIFYKLEKGKEASDDVVLKMAIDEWIKHYVVFDTPVPNQDVAAPVSAAEVSPASAVVSQITLDKK